MTSPTDDQTTRERWILKALRILLRPLVGFLIAEQVPFPALADLLKALYVDVADRDFAIEGKAASASRVALLTGVYRREVQRLRASEEDDPTAPEMASLGARLVARWAADPRFTDDAGLPLPLNRSSRREGRSVRELVETVSSDIRAQAVLDEWLRLGVVETDDGGRVHLRAGSFVAEHGFEEKAAFFARILRAHIAAGAHNLRGDGDPMLDQVVFYGGLRPDSAQRLRDRARELGLEALRTWNREASAAQDADRGVPGARERIHFGAYAFGETVSDPDELAALQPKDDDDA